eukprot:3774455-Rhodomonas_salina.1
MERRSESGERKREEGERGGAEMWRRGRGGEGGGTAEVSQESMGWLKATAAAKVASSRTTCQSMHCKVSKGWRGACALCSSDRALAHVLGRNREGRKQRQEDREQASEPVLERGEGIRSGDTERKAGERGGWKEE